MGRRQASRTPQTATLEPEPPRLPDRPSTAEWSQELTERLYRLLYVEGGARALDDSLGPLEATWGDGVYSELIFLLSHLRFPPDEARRHWTRIREHRDALRPQFGGDVDMRVALLSYFLHVNRQLDSPKVIELKLFEETQASAYRDELTGLFNHRAFREQLDRELRRGERHNHPMALLMIDVDDFKAWNDGNGHELGNAALAAIGRVLQRSVRKVDIAARYGGEEFVVVLPDTLKTEALCVAELLRSRVEAHHFSSGDGATSGHLTISVGLAAAPGDASHAAELIRCADRAMYTAKGRGKNQVALYGENRRAFKRWQADVPGSFRMLDEVHHPLRTINLGEGGLSFAAEAPAAAGALIEVRLALTRERDITAYGRVASTTSLPDGRHEVRVRFVEIPWEDRVLIAQHLRDAPNA